MGCEVTKEDRGEVGFRWKVWTKFPYIQVIFIYKCINITVKQMYKLYIRFLWGLYPTIISLYPTIISLSPTAWMVLQNTVSMQGSEIVKACILFGEKRCSGSNSKVCYSGESRDRTVVYWNFSLVVKWIYSHAQVFIYNWLNMIWYSACYSVNIFGHKLMVQIYICKAINILLWKILHMKTCRFV